MGETEQAARATWRLIGAAMCLGVVCTGAILVTLRADAESPSARPVPPPAAAPPASIADDPTVAPDPHESADNNVSFPVDI
jgi:hypothetical protein